MHRAPPAPLSSIQPLILPRQRHFTQSGVLQPSTQTSESTKFNWLIYKVICKTLFLQSMVKPHTVVNIPHGRNNMVWQKKKKENFDFYTPYILRKKPFLLF